MPPMIGSVTMSNNLTTNINVPAAPAPMPTLHSLMTASAKFKARREAIQDADDVEFPEVPTPPLPLRKKIKATLKKL